MFNNLLFGIIGVLMLSITGVGVSVARAQGVTPADVEERVSEAVERVAHEVAQVVRNVSADTSAELSADVEASSSASVSDSAPVSIGNPVETSSRSHDDENDGEAEWEDEDGDEDDDEDSRGGRTSGSASIAQASSVQSTPTPAPAPTPTPQVPATPSAVKTFTMAEVAQHSTAASCYSAINGNVYDLTSFINGHPGGSAAIKSLCGIDGTTAFNTQHGGASRPASELASLEIGVLAQ